MLCFCKKKRAKIALKLFEKLGPFQRWFKPMTRDELSLYVWFSKRRNNSTLLLPYTVRMT